MTTKETIITALSQLDHSNNDHWVDDGLPRTSVVQKLANDPTIRRQDINEAAPGFARKNSDPEEGLGTGAAPVEANAVVQDDELSPVAKQQDDELSPAAKQQISFMTASQKVDNLKRDRVLKRKMWVETDKQMVVDIQEAEQAMNKVRPRLTPGQNIQNHLRSEQEKRRAIVEATNQAALSPIDAMLTGRSRGNLRARSGGTPMRAVVGVDGNMVMPQPRSRLYTRTLPSLGTGAVPPKPV